MHSYQKADTCDGMQVSHTYVCLFAVIDIDIYNDDLRYNGEVYLMR